MTQEERLKRIEELRDCSPLDLPGKLMEIELFDEKSSQEVIDEIYKEFENGDDIKKQVLIPIFLSIADALLAGFQKKNNKNGYGLTSQRIFNDCEAFSYENIGTFKKKSEVSTNLINESKREDSHKADRGKYERKKYENKNAMDKYKKKMVEKNGGNKNIVDEYTRKRNITAFRNNKDERRNDSTNRYQAQPDHIVSLKEVHKQLAGNFALSDHDIKSIANKEKNLAVTSAGINQSKKEKTNEEYVGVSNEDDATKRNMVRMGKKAQRDIENEANKTVFKNLTFNGELSSAEKSAAHNAFEVEKGRKPTKDEKSKINKSLKSQKTKEVQKKLASDAGKQAASDVIGNVILFALKPLYFEFKDIFSNGLKKGVGASSGSEALEIRFGRMKKYLMENILGFIGDNLIEFVKSFISNLIEGIISLFVGILKQVLKIIKEGIKIFAESAKVLFGKDSSKMTDAQKGDAIIKLIGGSVLALAGIGIEILLNRLSVPEPWSIVISVALSGIASTLFMYLLDKIDIFSVKAEQRYFRIREIFEERRREIDEAMDSFDINTMETLKKQRIQFYSLHSKINSSLKANDIDTVNLSLYEVAEFFNIELGYRNTAEFVDYFDSAEVIKV